MQQWELQPWKQSRRLDSALTSITFHQTHRDFTESAAASAVMSWLFLDWFVPLYLLVSVLVLAGFGACLYFLEPGLQDAHKWSSKTVRHHPLVASVNCRDDDSNALI